MAGKIKPKTDQKLISAGEFYRRTKLTGPQMRVLEAAGVLKPSKTDAGWRQWRESDVTTGKRWKEQEQARKAKRTG